MSRSGTWWIVRVGLGVLQGSGAALAPLLLLLIDDNLHAEENSKTRLGFGYFIATRALSSLALVITGDLAHSLSALGATFSWRLRIDAASPDSAT